MADGETVFSRADGERTVRYSSLFSAGSTLRAAAQPAVMEVFLKRSPFQDELEAEASAWEGTSQVDGADCDVVRVSYADDDEDSRWCFSTETHLPLRLEWISDEGSTLLDLTHLVVNPTLPA